MTKKVDPNGKEYKVGGVTAQSGMVIIESWHRDEHHEKADHSSERSDGDYWCREPPLRRVTRHLMSFVVVRKRESACGPLWAAHVLCAVQAGVGIAWFA